MAYKIMGTTSSPFYSDMMIYYIMCDTPADLPSTISDIGYGTVIGYGSRADIISDSSKYLWNGSQWVRQTTSGGGGASSADQVSYDNTDSGLTATNVQDAIDELKDIDDMQDRGLAELYAENTNQQLEIDYAINTGAKNLLKITASSGVLNTAAIDIADDGSLHITGQPTANGAYVISSEIELVIPENAYILSMGAEAGNTKMAVSLRRAGTTQYVDLYRAESRIIPEGTYDRVHIYLYADTVYDTYVYPMIRSVEITDDTFEPYAPTNRELYETCETKVTMQQAYGDATAIPANSDLNNYTTPGIYYALVANASSIANTPYTSTGLRLVVEKNTLSGAAVFQTLYPTSRSHLEFYRRIYEGGSWSSWYKFEGTQVASVQSLNSPLTLNLSRNDLNESFDTNEIRETEEIEETNEIEETE